jgi:hypothetical protein
MIKVKHDNEGEEVTGNNKILKALLVREKCTPRLK